MHRLVFVALLLALPALAAPPSIYEKSAPAKTDKAYETLYQALYKSLEDNGFYVVFEPDIGKNLEGFAKRWGADYNRNKLDAIQSMVFCSGWYANQVSNLDPSLLATCPQHLTLTLKNGVATVHFLRPGLIAAGSPAEKLMKEMEAEVIGAIEAVLK